jgi:hypothetical protein
MIRINLISAPERKEIEGVGELLIRYKRSYRAIYGNCGCPHNAGT